MTPSAAVAATHARELGTSEPPSRWEYRLAFVSIAVQVATAFRLDSASFHPADVSYGRNALLAVAVWFVPLALLTIVSPVRVLRSFRWPTSLLLMLFGWALVTSPWSLHPGRSAFIATGFLAVTITVSTAVRILGSRTSLVALATGLTVLAAPGIVRWWQLSADSGGLFSRRLAGFTLEPNVAGQLGGLLLLIALLLWRRPNGPGPTLLLVSALAVGATTAVFSQTRTTTMGLTAAVVVMVLGDRRLLRTIGPLALVGVIAVASGAVDLSAPARVLSRGDTPERLETLSGRTVIWEATLDRVVDGPATGTGIGSGPAFYAQLADEGEIRLIASRSAHDLPLEIWRELGLPGVVLAGAAVAAAIAGGMDTDRAAVLAYLVSTSLTMPTAVVPAAMATAWVLTLTPDSDPP